VNYRSPVDLLEGGDSQESYYSPEGCYLEDWPAVEQEQVLDFAQVVGLVVEVVK